VLLRLPITIIFYLRCGDEKSIDDGLVFKTGSNLNDTHEAGKFREKSIFQEHSLEIFPHLGVSRQ